MDNAECFDPHSHNAGREHGQAHCNCAGLNKSPCGKVTYRRGRNGKLYVAGAPAYVLQECTYTVKCACGCSWQGVPVKNNHDVVFPALGKKETSR